MTQTVVNYIIMFAIIRVSHSFSVIHQISCNIEIWFLFMEEVFKQSYLKSLQVVNTEKYKTFGKYKKIVIRTVILTEHTLNNPADCCCQQTDR